MQAEAASIECAESNTNHQAEVGPSSGNESSLSGHETVSQAHNQDDQIDLEARPSKY